MEKGGGEIIALLVNHYAILDAIAYSLRHLECDWLTIKRVSVCGGFCVWRDAE